MVFTILIWTEEKREMNNEELGFDGDDFGVVFGVYDDGSGSRWENKV